MPALAARCDHCGQNRFGSREIQQLREALCAVVSQFDLDLPDALPIVHFGLFSSAPEDERPASPVRDDTKPSQLDLSALFSRMLLAFVTEFERESDLSLAMSANVLRVLDDEGIRVRDLPLLTGVSKEAISMAIGFLGKKGMTVIDRDPAGSGAKFARLTAQGRQAQHAYRRRWPRSRHAGDRALARMPSAVFASRWSRCRRWHS